MLREDAVMLLFFADYAPKKVIGFLNSGNPLTEIQPSPIIGYVYRTYTILWFGYNGRGMLPYDYVC